MKTEYFLILKDACAWPNLMHLSERRIGAVVFNRPSHGLEEGSLELWQGDRNGKNWQYLGTPCPNLPGQNRMHSCCGVDSSGAIHILSSGFTVADNSFVRLEPVWHSFSSDGGITWEITRDLHIEGVDPHHIPHGNILFGTNGHLYATVYKSYGPGNPSYSWFIESCDNGVSWKMHSRIGNGDTNEAHVIVVKRCRFAAVRTHIDHHTRLFKSDMDSESWQDCGPLTLPMQHPGHLLAVGDSGLLLTYGIRNKGLMAIGARFSAGLGQSWSPPFILYQLPESASDCGYPSSLLLDDGWVITGLYTNCSRKYQGYQFGVVRWQLADFLSPRELDAISDGRKLTIF